MLNLKRENWRKISWPCIVYNQSLAMKKKSIGQDSTVAETLKNIGISLYKQGRLDEAMAEYKGSPGSLQEYSGRR